jgi:hypothetical protein
MLVSAPLGDRSDASEHLQGSGVGEAFAALAKGGEQARGEDWTCAWQGREELVVGE